MQQCVKKWGRLTNSPKHPSSGGRFFFFFFWMFQLFPFYWNAFKRRVWTFTNTTLCMTHNQRQTDSTVLQLSWKLELGNREQDVGRRSEGKKWGRESSDFIGRWRRWRRFFVAAVAWCRTISQAAGIWFFMHHLPAQDRCSFKKEKKMHTECGLLAHERACTHTQPVTHETNAQMPS